VLDDEQRARHGQREEIAASERRNAVLAGEVEELRSQIDVLEKTRKMADTELREISERIADLTNANAALLAAKKKTELELQSLHVRTTDISIIFVHREIFLPARRCASEVFAVIACPSVCLSVRPSQAGIVSKQLNVGSQKQRSKDSSFTM